VTSSTSSAGDAGKADPQHDRAAAETGGVFAAQIVTHLLRYAGAVCLAQAVGVAWFGTYTLGLTVVTVLGMVSLMGVAPGALPLLARARRAADAERLSAVVKATWVIVLICAVPATLAVTLGGRWIGIAAFDEPALASILPLFGFFVLLSALSRGTAGLVQGLLGAHRQALIEPLLVVAVTVVGLVCTWYFDWGITAAVLATLAGPLAGVVVGARLVFATVPDAARLASPAKLPVRELFANSWPLMGVSTFAFLLMWMDVLLMGVFRGADEVGVYGACARLAVTVLLLHSAAGPVLLARLSTHIAGDEWAAARHLYRATGRWSAWAGATLAGILIVWRHELLGLFGEQFVVGASTLAVLASGRLVTASVGMCGQVLVATGRGRLGLLNLIVMVACNGVLDILWIPRHGGMGAAAATCASIVLVKSLQSVQVWRIFGMHPFSTQSLKALPAIAVVTVLAETAKSGPTSGYLWLVGLAGFALVCGLLYYWLGADEDDRSVIGTWLRRSA